jgi:glycosyltransferase involved in cell wall biosynthesis
MILSIITINYNDEKGLVKTIASVRNLLLKIKKIDIEFIIIDGGSDDGSVDVINDNRNIIHKSVSEKDHGIYDAMNKGVNIASGDYVLFMNSGDVLYYGFNEKMLPNIVSDDEIYTYNNIVKISNIFIPRDIKVGMMPCHQAMIIPRKVLVVNKFDLNFRIAADYKLNKKILSELKIIHNDEYICINELGGISNNWPSFSKLYLHIRELVTIDNLSSFPKYKLILSMFFKFICIKIIGYKYFYILRLLK